MLLAPLALLLLADPGAVRQDPPPAVPANASPAQVRKLLGTPARVSRQILAQRYLEQWVYDAPHRLRVEFDCVRGRQPRLIAVRPLADPAP